MEREREKRREIGQRERNRRMERITRVDGKNILDKPNQPNPFFTASSPTTLVTCLHLYLPSSQPPSISTTPTTSSLPAPLLLTLWDEEGGGVEGGSDGRPQVNHARLVHPLEGALLWVPLHGVERVPIGWGRRQDTPIRQATKYRVKQTASYVLFLNMVGKAMRSWNDVK